MTFSATAQWVDVLKFANTQFITCDETTASYSLGGTREFTIGDYATGINGAGGSVVDVSATSGDYVKIACITTTQFAESATLTVTVSGTPTVYTITNVTACHGTHNWSLQNLADRDEWLKANSGIVLKIGSTLYQVSSVSTISTIKIDGSLVKNGTTLSLLSGSGSTLSNVAVDHSLSLSGGSLTLKNASGSNLTTVALGSTSGGWNQSFATNGYCKMPNGLIVQWGYEPLGTDGNNESRTVTLPTAFNNAMLCAIAESAGEGVGGSTSTEGTSTQNYSTTSFEIKHHWNNGGKAAHWIAIGY